MWYVFEGLALILVGVGSLTQIIVPIVMGTKMFPLFRRKKLVSDIVEAREALDQAQLEAEARIFREKVASMKKEAQTKDE